MRGVFRGGEGVPAQGSGPTAGLLVALFDRETVPSVVAAA